MRSIAYRGSTPRPGQAISSSDFSDLADASTWGRGQMINGQTIGLQAGGGLALIPNRAIASTPATIPTPFKIYASKNIVDGTWDDTYNITLYPGLLNLCLPSNIFSTINQGISSTQYVILTAESDGYAITSSTWSVQGDAPTPQEANLAAPPSTAIITLGVIFYNADSDTITVFQLVFDNLTASPSIWLSVPVADPQPFAQNLDNYYIWNITKAE